MDKPNASQTAIRVATLRAAHQILDGEPKILVDPISVGFFAQASETAIRADAARLMAAPMRRIRANFVLRSRFAEDHLAEAVARGVDQYLILGAGLDTFSYRQPSWARSLHIVEIDHPASQAFKLASLADAGIAIPENVEYLAVDFARGTLSDKLIGAQLDEAKPVFISWLGVTQYLPREALLETLRTLAGWHGGAEVALTYIEADRSTLDADARKAMDNAEARALASGEPWLSKFGPDEFTELLTQAGFVHVEHLSIEAATHRYFRDRADGLRPAGGTGLVLAKT